MELERVDGIIERHGADPSSLIQVLLDIQKENQWLPPEVLKRVSERLQVPMARVRHVATFYKAFSLVPRGRHEIHVCMGTACHVRGAPRVLNAVQDVTGIGPGETDMELTFTLKTVNCVGCCALGPVVEIDGVTYGKMTPSKAAEVIRNYK
jgi:NADH-quinone oxidoreductase subunit E